MGNICSTTPDIETRLFQPCLPPPMQFLSSESYYLTTPHDGYRDRKKPVAFLKPMDSRKSSS